MLCCGGGEEEDDGTAQNQYATPPRGGSAYAAERGEPRPTNMATRSGALQQVLPIETPAMSLSELNGLTGNFGQKSLIGEGSNGRVFCATLSSGQQVAIKKLDTSASQESDPDFAAQLSVVSRLKNENFVELLGYCLESNNRILVYQFATQGSLHNILHGRKGVEGAEPGPVLNWNQRMNNSQLSHSPASITQATPRLSEDKVKQCVDPKLNNDFPPKAIAKLAAVAALCVQYEADFRPNMTIVVKALSPLLNSKPAGPDSRA
ncbi:hypothetical protein SAY87_017712 [Trapa incisa]|uniref:Protein kinase domain-containing protein n=1 Tax=Trapa incisa TaxID=236973 RepID=A0AAN7L2V6_9MYRT|nr:hypothetical protein SAY87_017712 [Trapa incisa]